jgi:cap1 methyltransferase
MKPLSISHILQGICVDGEENWQESKCKQLVLCQFLTALHTLDKGGDFMCKMFDAFTPFTISLLYLLHLHFEKICLIKPHTSRPANSERYVVCKNLLQRRPPVVEYLFYINDQLNELKDENKDDILNIIPEQMMFEDTDFVAYIRQSNIDLVKQQIEALELLIKYYEDRDLVSLDQKKIREACLTEWKLPSQMPEVPYAQKVHF